jgi:hypothetical protein
MDMAKRHRHRPDRFRDTLSQIGPTACATAQLVIQIWLIVVHRGPLGP